MALSVLGRHRNGSASLMVNIRVALEEIFTFAWNGVRQLSLSFCIIR
jgi:hypothetical protein